MINLLKKLYIKIVLLKIQIYTFMICVYYGLEYDRTWQFVGRPYIHRPYRMHKTRTTALKIGKHFKLMSTFDENALGLIQPVFINARDKNCQVIIGDHVGISGSTISCGRFISIGNNVMIGSGCLIMDNDAHNTAPDKRKQPLSEDAYKPVIIEDDVFIGTRSIILKGVTIGKGSVVGAGSVVTKSVPSYTIVGGNPAKIIGKV